MATATRILILLLVLSASTCGMSLAQTSVETVVDVASSGLVDKLPGGQVDWGGEMFYATGEGAMPAASEQPNRSIAFLKAKDYAKMDAIANLLMLVEGTAISNEAVGRDYMVQDLKLTQRISRYIKNDRII